MGIVMTSYLYHLMFEEIKDSECIFLLNDLRKGNRNDKTRTNDTVKRTSEKDERLYKRAWRTNKGKCEG